jgi:hypothetical protein
MRVFARRRGSSRSQGGASNRERGLHTLPLDLLRRNELLERNHAGLRVHIPVQVSRRTDPWKKAINKRAVACASSSLGRDRLIQTGCCNALVIDTSDQIKTNAPSILIDGANTD